MTQENDDLVVAILTLGTVRRDEAPTIHTLMARFIEGRDALQRVRDMEARQATEAWDRQHGVDSKFSTTGP